MTAVFLPWSLLASPSQQTFKRCDFKRHFFFAFLSDRTLKDSDRTLKIFRIFKISDRTLAMNTSTSDMASFPIPPLGSHWFHESDLIGDLFDLTLCISNFAAPLMESASSFSTIRSDIFKIVPIGFEIYICMLAVEPAVTHMLSWRKELASEPPHRRHISGPFETPPLSL